METRRLTTQNLGTIEEYLEEGSFFRVSRSYLVNLRFLSRVDRKAAAAYWNIRVKSYSIKIPAKKIKMLEASFS